MCAARAGNLHEYWALFESHRNCAGGFIWDWADQCPVRRIQAKPPHAAHAANGNGHSNGHGNGNGNGNGHAAPAKAAGAGATAVEYWATGGDFGDKPNDVQFCANGIVFPDRT